MKRVRRFSFVMILIVCLSICLFGCSTKQEQLATPVNLSISGGVLYWDEVENASGYILMIDGIEHQSVQNAYALTAITVNGSYEMKVKAISDNSSKYSDSEYSQSIRYNLTGAEGTVILSPPQNVYTSGSFLNFDTVSNASRYQIYIDGVLTATQTATRYQLPTLEDGRHYAEVVAQNPQDLDIVDSDKSSAYYFVVENGTVLAEQLATPSHLMLSGRVLSWTSNANAVGYIVNLDGIDLQRVLENSRELDLTPGEHVVKVQAVGDGDRYRNSLFSSVLITPTFLPVISDIAIFDNRIVWSESEYAAYYTLELDGSTYISSTPYYDLNNSLADGSHTVKVRAIGDGVYASYSPYSSELVFTKSGDFTETRLEAPEGITITGNVITWDSNPFASGYIIRFNSTEIALSNASYTIPSVTSEYTFSIKAVGDDIHILDSLYSLEYTNGSTEKSLRTTIDAFYYSSPYIRWSRPSDVESGEVYYILELNGIEYELGTTNFNMSYLDEGTYKARVRAYTFDEYTCYSREIEFHTDDTLANQVTLFAPDNLSFSNGLLTFDAAIGAAYYEIILNDEIIAVTTNTQYDFFSNNVLGYNGIYTIKVRSRTSSTGGQLSAYSEEIIYRYQVDGNEKVTAYTISTVAELQAIADDLTAEYILLNDIDLVDVEWTPLGTVDESFTGVLNGNGYSISNLQLDAPYGNFGLFYINEGVIANLRVIGVDINTQRIDVYSNYAIGVIAVENEGLINNCLVQGTISNSGDAHLISGLVARNRGVVSECEVNIEYNLDKTASSVNMGGAIGNNWGYVTAKVSTDITLVGDSNNPVYLGGAIYRNYGLVDLEVGSMGVLISLQAQGVNVHIGGLIASQYESIAPTSGNLTDSITIESLILPTTNTYSGRGISIEVTVANSGAEIGGIVHENSFDMQDVTMPSVTLSIDRVDSIPFGGFACINSGDISRIVLPQLSCSFGESASDIASAIGGLVYSNSGTVSNSYYGDFEIVVESAIRLEIGGIAATNSGTIEYCRNGSIDIDAIDVAVVSFAELAYETDSNSTLYDCVFNADVGAMKSDEYFAFCADNRGVIDGCELTMVFNDTSAATTLSSIATIGENRGEVKNLTIDLAISLTRTIESMSIYGVCTTNYGTVIGNNVSIDITQNSGSLELSGLTKSNSQGTTVSGNTVVLDVDYIAGGKANISGATITNNGSYSSGNVTMNIDGVYGLSSSVGGFITNNGTVSGEFNLNIADDITSVASARFAGVAVENNGSVMNTTANVVAHVSSPITLGGAFVVHSSGTISSVFVVLDLDFISGSDGSTVGGLCAETGTTSSAYNVVVFGTANRSGTGRYTAVGLNGAVAIGLNTNFGLSDTEIPYDLSYSISLLPSYFSIVGGLPITTSTEITLLPTEADITYSETTTVDINDGSNQSINDLVNLSLANGVGAPVWLSSSEPRRAIVSNEGVLTCYRNGVTTLNGVMLVNEGGAFSYVELTVSLSVTGAFDIVGDGSANNPYQIDTPARLEYMEEEPDSYFKLTADITPTLSFESLCSSVAFSGVLEGDGHIIGPFSFAANNNGVGLFSKTDGATISNVTITIQEITDQSNVSSTLFVGGISVFAKDTTIIGCHVEYKMMFELTTNRAEFGGIAYSIDADSEIQRSSVGFAGVNTLCNTLLAGGAVYNNNGLVNKTKVVFQLETSDKRSELGGIAKENNGIISGSTAWGIVASNGSDDVMYAGVVGYNKGSVVNCYSSMRFEIDDAEGSIGGFANYNTGSFTTCYVSGYLKGGEYCVKGSFLSNNISTQGEFADCYVDDSTYGYTSMISYKLSDGVEPSDLSGLAVQNMQNVSVAIFDSAYWRAPTAELPYPTLLDISGQTMGTIALTGSMPNVAFSDDKQTIASNFNNVNSYTSTFVNARWALVSGGTYASISPNSEVVTISSGTVVIKYTIGLVEQTFSFDVAAFAYGNGTVSNPYIISSVEELLRVYTDLGAHYKISDDVDIINMNNNSLSIGSIDTPFTGTFDGNGKTITGFVIELGASSGMFVALDGATISNLNLIATAAPNSGKVQVIYSGGGGNMVAGILAGTATDSTLQNIQIDAALSMSVSIIDLNSSVTSVKIGGIVGTSTNTTVSGSTVNLSFGTSSTTNEVSDKITINTFGEGLTVGTSSGTLTSLNEIRYTAGDDMAFTLEKASDTQLGYVTAKYKYVAPADFSSVTGVIDDISNTSYTITSGTIAVLEQTYLRDTLTVRYTDANGNTLVVNYYISLSFS